MFALFIVIIIVGALFATAPKDTHGVHRRQRERTESILASVKRGLEQHWANLDTFPDFLTELAGTFLPFAEDEFRDGYGKPLAYAMASGITSDSIDYVVVAVVAPGKNGEVDTPLSESALLSPIFAIEGDDTGVVLSSLPQENGRRARDNYKGAVLRVASMNFQAVSGSLPENFDRMGLHPPSLRTSWFGYFDTATLVSNPAEDAALMAAMEAEINSEIAQNGNMGNVTPKVVTPPEISMTGQNDFTNKDLQ